MLLESILNRFLLQPVSVVIFALLGGWFCIETLPSDGVSYTKFWVAVVFWGIATALYSLLVHHVNRLPCAKGQPGVLFVFHTETEQLFREVEFNIREDFSRISDEFKAKVAPVCINANRIKNYSSGNKKLILDLLRKTNCVFCVDVVYQTNDAEKRDHYEMKINVQTVHLEFSEEKNKIVEGEVKRMTEPVKNLKFRGIQKMEVLNFAATHLNLASKYITAIVFIISNDFVLSNELLEDLMISGKEFHFYESIKRACFISNWGLESLNFEKFNQTNDNAYIDVAEKHLERMNSLFPNTYGYHLDMAKIQFVKHRDVSAARKHIAVCKRVNADDHWKYSDAFLCAYLGGDACLIIKKYEEALETDYNVIDIIAFIENILDLEPDKSGLHLGLAILYHSLGDNKMIMSHLKAFLADYYIVPKEKRLIKKIEQLKGEQCKICVLDNCESCGISA